MTQKLAEHIDKLTPLVAQFASLMDTAAGVSVENGYLHAVQLRFLPGGSRVIFQESIRLAEDSQGLPDNMPQWPRKPDWLAIGIPAAGFIVRQLLIPPIARREIGDFLASNSDQFLPPGLGEKPYFYRYSVLRSDTEGLHLLLVIGRSAALKNYPVEKLSADLLTLSPLGLLAAIPAEKAGCRQWLINQNSQHIDYLTISQGSIISLALTVSTQDLADQLPGGQFSSGVSLYPPATKINNATVKLLKNIDPARHLAALLALSANGSPASIPDLSAGKQSAVRQNKLHRAMAMKFILAGGIVILCSWLFLVAMGWGLNSINRRQAQKVEAFAPLLAERDSLLAIEAQYRRQIRDYQAMAQQRSYQAFLQHLISNSVPANIWLQSIETLSPDSGRQTVRIGGLSLDERLIGELLLRYEETAHVSAVKLSSMKTLDRRTIRQRLKKSYSQLVEFKLELQVDF